MLCMRFLGSFGGGTGQAGGPEAPQMDGNGGFGRAVMAEESNFLKGDVRLWLFHSAMKNFSEGQMRK